MTETTKQVDERRAIAIAAVEADIEWENRTDNERREWRKYARAIRASDEATGMVLVPREPPLTGNYLVDEIRKQNWPIMIAAHKGDAP